MDSTHANQDEGLGTVYERHRLWDLLDSIHASYGLSRVLEAPVRGMSGIAGINTVPLAQKDVAVVLADMEWGVLDAARRSWIALGRRPVLVRTGESLPFRSKSFDLAFNFNGLWHWPDPGRLLKELVRVSRKVVLLVLPNLTQAGYLWARFGWNRSFFKRHQALWGSADLVRKNLYRSGVRLVREGVMDCPPWPDTGLAVSRLFPRSDANAMRRWRWSSLDYLLGKDPAQKKWVERLGFVENSNLPLRLKSLWAHHRYLMYETK
ncbi:MAG: class I SAM-dependent methyltransferase [Deltaproteobacteria bacterium]|nr:class I SAM-dependent methyltransferase [Deltaproteobacteria bacterium]